MRATYEEADRDREGSRGNSALKTVEPSHVVALIALTLDEADTAHTQKEKSAQIAH